MTYQIPQEVLDLRSIRIEANITQRCNARCWSCNKAVGYADGVLQDMTVDQMKKAVDQLLEHKINVRRFTFCGGEPILHRDLQAMLEEVARLPKMKYGVRILTNAMPVTKAKRDKIKLPAKWFHWVENALDDPSDPYSGKNDPKKRPNKRYHTPFWISPEDVGIESRYENCTVRGWCGIGLDAEGWSMCGKAQMMSKLLGIEGASTWDGDIFKHMHTPIQEMCKHCPYGMRRIDPGGKVRTDKYLEKEILRKFQKGELEEFGVTEDGISPTWREAFSRFESCDQEQELVQLEPVSCP